MAKPPSEYNESHNSIAYLDNASTTKVDTRVLDEMLPYFAEIYGNASSNHSFGKKAKDAIDKARTQVSNLVNCNSQEIIFTSGATESINLALKGYVESNADKGNHLITVKTEHKAVLATCEYLETKGYEVTYLDVDENGIISMNQLKDSIRNDTLLITVMYVNNETGIIQPIKEIGLLCKEKNIAFLCDATQAVGKIEVDVEEDSIDMLCFSGHKLNGPKGIGVLYKRNDIEITPLIHGGGQEYGLRGGTYNTPLIVGLGKACEIAKDEMITNSLKIKELNTYVIKTLRKFTPFNEISEDSFRVSNIINIIIPNVDSDIFMDKYKLLAVSNGSACNTAIMEESHVIKAMLPNESYKNNYLRISLDKYSLKENIDFLAEALNNYLKPNNAK